MNTDLLEVILKAADKEKKSTEHLLLKLMEEVGEASQAFLSKEKAAGSDYKELSLGDFQEELVDVLLVTITLLNRTEISEDDFTILLNNKINKWLEKQKNI